MPAACSCRSSKHRRSIHPRQVWLDPPKCFDFFFFFFNRNHQKPNQTHTHTHESTRTAHEQRPTPFRSRQHYQLLKTVAVRFRFVLAVSGIPQRTCFHPSVLRGGVGGMPPLDGWAVERLSRVYRRGGWLSQSKDQQVTRTRTRQQNTRQQNKPLTRTQSEQRHNDA